MKIFLALTVAFLIFALNTIQIDAENTGHSGHVNANSQIAAQ
jgi:hypothetical protein